MQSFLDQSRQAGLLLRGQRLGIGKQGIVNVESGFHGVTIQISVLPVNHQEFLKFLRRLDAEFPGDIALHLVMDNYGTHKHPKVQTWLKRHPRFVPHFVPTSSSWLNLVERWSSELTAKAIRRGSFASVADLESAIAQFLEAWNENPKPFVWTATVESIQAKLARCRQTLEQIKPGCTAPRTRKIKPKSPVISRTPH